MSPLEGMDSYLTPESGGPEVPGKEGLDADELVTQAFDIILDSLQKVGERTPDIQPFNAARFEQLRRRKGILVRQYAHEARQEHMDRLEIIRHVRRDLRRTLQEGKSP